jgi:hypothetical protein
MLFVLLLDYKDKCGRCNWYHCHVITTLLLTELRTQWRTKVKLLQHFDPR